MAELLDIDRLTLFLFFVVPGFISMRVYDLFVPAGRRNFSEAAVDVISYSIVNLALFGWILPVVQRAYPNGYIVVLYAVLFVTPALLGILVYLGRKLPMLRGKLIHPTPTGWDHFFGKGEPCWVLFHLKSGQKVDGYYAGDSLASSFPQEQEVYVQQVWRLDERYRFIEAVEQTAGLIIRGDECEFIELFRFEEGDEDGPFRVSKAAPAGGL